LPSSLVREKLPTESFLLQCVHLKHVLWSSMPSTCTRSFGYAVVPQAVHLLLPHTTTLPPGAAACAGALAPPFRHGPQVAPKPA